MYELTSNSLQDNIQLWSTDNSEVSYQDPISQSFNPA